MERLEQLFAEYEKNFIWINQMDEKARQEKPMKAWLSDLSNNFKYYHVLFRRNTEIVTEILTFIEKDFTKEDADLLYALSKKMYEDYVDDGLFLYKIYEKLIVFYEKEKDYSKYVILNSYADYLLNDVIGSQFYRQSRDAHHCLDVLKYRDYYQELAEEARYRFFACYYNLIIAGADSKTISVDEAFTYYYDMQKLWNEDAVQKLDGENEKIGGMVALVTQRMIVLESQMTNASPKNQQEFCKLARQFYEEEMKNVSDVTEMDMMVYVAFLRSQILLKERTLEENFDTLVSYYRDQCYAIQDSNETSSDEVFYLVRTCTTLVDWMKEGIPKEKTDRIISDLLMMLETKWKKLKYVHSPEIDDLLYDFVKLVLQLPFDSSEKKRYAFEFGIRRQIPTFMNAVTVKNIATQFLKVILEKKRSLFDSLSYMSEMELYNFVEQSAIFHNFGNIDYKLFRGQPYRKLLPEERKWVEEHVEIGAESVKSTIELQKYHDVILYHHHYYDGTERNGKNSGYAQSPYKAVIDLIAIIDYIDEFTNPILCESYRSSDFEICLKELQNGRGHRFNKEMVDILSSSYELQDKITYALNEGRRQLAYSLYHSFDVGATEEEKEAYLEETIQMIESNPSEEELRRIEARIDHLFVIAENNFSSRFIGYTYYVAARFYELRGDSVRIMNYATHGIHFLNESKEYGIITRLYNMLGMYSAYNGDHGVAVNHFLMSAEYSRKNNNSYGIGVSYCNIANLFMELNNYVKALEYVERAEPDFAINTMNQGYMICYKGYCYCELLQFEKARDIREQLLVFMEENPDYPKFICNLFLACMSYYENEKEKAKVYLEPVYECEELTNGYQDYINEQDILYDLLFDLEMYDKLSEILIMQIKICEKEAIPSHLSRKLIRRMIQCAKKMHRADLVNKYGEKLDEVFQREDQHRIELVLESEYSALDNIARQEKHEEILNDNFKLKEGLKNAEHANEAKNAFLSSMSHEIRTPIHAVLGLDEMILRETTEENVKKYAEDIQNAGKTLLGLINDILDFSKLEAGKMELVPEEYLVKDMICELDNMIASRAEQKHLSFHVKMNTAMPAKLFGDDLRIKQIILNLLTNAVKYTEKGSVTFSVDFEKKNGESILLRVIVSDTGIGMKPEEMDKLSKPFERLDIKKNKTIEGTGLGMSIVTNLLNQMNSKLQVESTYGVGSSFSFELEQRVVDWTQIGELSEKNGLVVPKKTGPVFIAPEVKILVVDDTAVNLTVVKGLLKRNKLQLTTARSGKECLEICQKETFHLILLDHRMPEMDGIETLHHLKEEDGLNKETPVIALTANAITGAYEYYMKEGFDELVIKPVNGRHLEEKILQFIPKEYVTICT